MIKEKQTPEIRFKGFTDAWEQCKLLDFGVATGGTSIESEFSDNGIYKVISIGSYSEQSKYNDQNIRAIHSDKTKIRVLNKDDLAMILNDKTSSGRIIGRVLLVDKSGEFVYNQRTERIETNVEKYDANFLYHFLNAPNIRCKIIKQSQGNTQIFVNWTSIQNTEYNIPDKVEQVKLGRLFEKIDTLITLHQRKCDKLLNFKESMLEKMFPKNSSNIPKIRFKGFTDAWEQRKLKDIGDILTGSTPSTSHEEYYSSNGMLWVTPTDIDSNIIKSTTRMLSDKGEKVARIIPENTILVTCIASIGKNAIVFEKSSFNQQINSLTPFSNYNPYFLLTDSVLWSNKMKQQGASGMMQIVNKNEFSKLETMIPSYKEQDKIGNIFKQIDNLITLHQRKLEKLNNMKKSMLNKMFV